MKTKILETTCQVCRRSIKVEIEEPALFSDEFMASAIVCDDCEADHSEQERTRIAKFNKAIERECEGPPERKYREPYVD